ncbi:MAG: hypothetical protein AAFR27_11255, partial [Pseudomonadota bacterium]
MFRIECLDAKEGDCLILHFGREDRRRFALIDSGSRGTYNQVLKKRLLDLKKSVSPDEPLHFELGMVSHIDQDHIKGFLDFFDRQEKGQSPEVDMMEFRRFWHNSYSAIMANIPDALLASLNAPPNSDGRWALMTASFEQGDALSAHLLRLGIGTNSPHNG